MSDPFIGEIRMFGGNFAPRGWALCDGQLLQISQNDALFSLLGTIYGGDGRTSFGLPDMRGRIPIHADDIRQGTKSGSEDVTLTLDNIPSHDAMLSNVIDTDAIRLPKPNQSFDTAFASNQAQTYGGGQPHNNLQPYCCVNFIIALFGVYPSRT